MATKQQTFSQQELCSLRILVQTTVDAKWKYLGEKYPNAMGDWEGTPDNAVYEEILRLEELKEKLGPVYNYGEQFDRLCQALKLLQDAERILSFAKDYEKENAADDTGEYKDAYFTIRNAVREVANLREAVAPMVEMQRT